MIARTLTELYLKHFNQLHGLLCLCWQSAFINTAKQLDLNKLKEYIRSNGIYNHENAVKIEEPFDIKEKTQFKTLTWVNDCIDDNNDNIFCEYIELYEQALSEVRDNLLEISEKSKQIAYANFILHDFNRSFQHIQNLSESEKNNKCKEFFEFVLNRQLISENNQSTTSPNYNLSVRLINHLDFIDKLIEMFSYLDIDLLQLSKKHKHNLYLFDEYESYMSVDSIFHSSIETKYIEQSRRINFQKNILPKFNCSLSDDCLIKIMLYLANKRLLENPNTDNWLFWFNRKMLKNPESLRWNGTSSMLSNVIQQLSGTSCSKTIKIAFCTKDYAKPTRKEYESGRTYKEIEQIITVSKQKK